MGYIEVGLTLVELDEFLRFSAKHLCAEEADAL